MIQIQVGLAVKEMALSLATLNHLSSTRFTPHFTISNPTTKLCMPLPLPAFPKRRRFQPIIITIAASASASASGDDNYQSSHQLPSSSPQLLLLNVEGMMCEGCADSVKKLLESRPQVSSASVNLTEKIANVWLAPEAKTESNWHNKLGGALAEHLTNCGFKSSLQVTGQKDSN